MSRAEIARNKEGDDIPIARRSNRASWAKWKFIFFIALIAAVFGPNIFFRQTPYRVLFQSKKQSPEQLVKTLPSPDGRLLGHFPYSQISGSDLVEVDSGIKVHSETAKAYIAMKSAAKAEGISLVLLSGYRSHKLQKTIFFDLKSKRNQTAIERARVSAPPGYSEHSTGYAIDIGDYGRPKTDFSEDFESTAAFRWLAANAAKYHFILSFPKNNSQGVTYEPWHWRFEGSAAALREFEPARRLMPNP